MEELFEKLNSPADTRQPVLVVSPYREVLLIIALGLERDYGIQVACAHGVPAAREILGQMTPVAIVVHCTANHGVDVPLEALQEFAQQCPLAKLLLLTAWPRATIEYFAAEYGVQLDEILFVPEGTSSVHRWINAKLQAAS